MSKRYCEVKNIKSTNIQKRRKINNLMDIPPINSIKDLIKLGRSLEIYKNIDMIMLWSIIPYLEELDNMVGMKTLKDSIFYQILYYIQGMHKRNDSEEYLHTILFGPPGVGKCLGINTPILMYNGTIKMVQNIKKGDLLMGDDSTPRTVLSTCKGRETMYKVKQHYGEDYIINESHILSLKLYKSPVITELFNENMFSVEWCDIEGCHKNFFNYESHNKNEVKQKINVFVNTLPNKGDVIDISLKDYLSRTKKWKKMYKGYKVSIDFEYVNTEKDSYIKGFFLDNESISKEYLINNKKKRLQLLAGILDSKGNKNINNNFEINEENDILAKNIIFLSKSLGFKTITTKCISKKIKYNIVISGNITQIPTKILKTTNYYNNNNHNIYDIKIEKLTEDNYYGFVIDGNHRFILQDFTVTHNTNVAQIIGRIYRSMGILSKNGPFKIAYRDDFIARYLGQTSIKTRKLLNSCLGGVLFIDEVYSLGPGQEDKDSFSKEAIDTLCSFLSEHPNDFCCIAAGYEKDINKCFFAVNKGLESRFQWKHRIEKYSTEELSSIFIKKVKNMNWHMDINSNIIMNIINENKKCFENAGRDIINFISKCKIAHARRVLGLSKEHKFFLNKKDLQNGIKLMKKCNFKETNLENSPLHSLYI